MRKSDIASHVATRTSLSKAAPNAAVNAVFNTITDALVRGEAVTVTGLGTFSTRTRPVREGRNPLHLAVTFDSNVAITHALIDGGVQPNAADAEGAEPRCTGQRS